MHFWGPLQSQLAACGSCRCYFLYHFAQVLSWDGTLSTFACFPLISSDLMYEHFVYRGVVCGR
jgi:hypothetical protein